MRDTHHWVCFCFTPLTATVVPTTVLALKKICETVYEIHQPSLLYKLAILFAFCLVAVMVKVLIQAFLWSVANE